MQFVALSCCFDSSNETKYGDQITKSFWSRRLNERITYGKSNAMRLFELLEFHFRTMFSSNIKVLLPPAKKRVQRLTFGASNECPWADMTMDAPKVSYWPRIFSRRLVVIQSESGLEKSFRGCVIERQTRQEHFFRIRPASRWFPSFVSFCSWYSQIFCCWQSASEGRYRRPGWRGRRRRLGRPIRNLESRRREIEREWVTEWGSDPLTVVCSNLYA